MQVGVGHDESQRSLHSEPALTALAEADAEFVGSGRSRDELYMVLGLPDHHGVR